MLGKASGNTFSRPKGIRTESEASPKAWLEIQLVDEQGKPVANMPCHLISNDTRGRKVVSTVFNDFHMTDENGVIKKDNFDRMPLTLIVEGQKLADEMEQRPLALVRPLQKTQDKTPEKLKREKIAIWERSPIQRQIDEDNTPPLWFKEQYGSSYTQEKIGKKYCFHYVYIGQLCDREPKIENWSIKKDTGEEKTMPLPSCHFPLGSFKGFPIAIENLNKRHIIQICPFRAWVLSLEHREEYSLVNAWNLSLMSKLSYKNKKYIEAIFGLNVRNRRDKSKKEREEQLSKIAGNSEWLNVSRIPRVMYNFMCYPIVKDVPFSQRYLGGNVLATERAKQGHTQFFYMYSKTDIITAWRGTKNTTDFAVTDINILQQESPKELSTEGSVHQGFLFAFELVRKVYPDEYQAFRNLLSENRKLFITGHSLGGALGLLQSVSLKAYNPVLYTYGMPRTFTQAAIASFNNLNHFRHVNENDPIPELPLARKYNKKLYNRINDAFERKRKKIKRLCEENPALVGRFPNKALMLSQFRNRLLSSKQDYDPYGHQGKLVNFSKSKQDSMKGKVVSLPTMRRTRSGLKFPKNRIKLMLPKKIPLKLYIVSTLNEQYVAEAKNVLECLPKNDLLRIKLAAPKWNLFDHGSKSYLKIIYSQLMEVIDRNSTPTRIKKREKFR